MRQEILDLTKKLVSIPSQNGTKGEREIADFLYEYLKSFPYFQKHPEQVMQVPLKEDPLGRVNVYGLLLGEKEKSGDTIILHGHIDTVGIEDFADLMPYAFDCDRLREELLNIQDQLSEEVRKDLLSGDYLFGRGASDMKSGDAVHLAVMEEMAKHPEQLRGNLLISLNPVEESLHTGFIEGIDTLIALREQYGLHYLFAINNDYICGMYPNDETRYLYTGSVGKLLPCFYIHGKETHVGQAFEGIDPCRIAAEIIKRINLNCDLCDGYKGEYPAPPIALKMSDLKPYYSVQTPISSFVYFNYMVHNKNVSTVLRELKEIAGKAADYVMQEINERYERYCKMTKSSFRKITTEIQILEYQEVYQAAEKKYQSDLDRWIDQKAKESIAKGDDKRETSLKIVEGLFEIAGIKEPSIVVFFATPHCPHNTLKEEIPKEKKLTQEIWEIAKKFGEKEKETFQMMYFFPSLTDSSYLKIDDDDESIKILEKNFPKQDLLYPVPYQKIRELNIPGLNFGAFGKDAHKWTERVKISYSFEKLPKLMIETIQAYLM